MIFHIRTVNRNRNEIEAQKNQILSPRQKEKKKKKRKKKRKKKKKNRRKNIVFPLSFPVFFVLFWSPPHLPHPPPHLLGWPLLSKGLPLHFLVGSPPLHVGSPFSLLGDLTSPRWLGGLPSPFSVWTFSFTLFGWRVPQLGCLAVSLSPCWWGGTSPRRSSHSPPSGCLAVSPPLLLAVFTPPSLFVQGSDLPVPFWVGSSPLPCFFGGLTSSCWLGGSLLPPTPSWLGGLPSPCTAWEDPPSFFGAGWSPLSLRLFGRVSPPFLVGPHFWFCGLPFSLFVGKKREKKRKKKKGKKEKRRKEKKEEKGEKEKKRKKEEKGKKKENLRKKENQKKIKNKKRKNKGNKRKKRRQTEKKRKKALKKEKTTTKKRKRRAIIKGRRFCEVQTCTNPKGPPKGAHPPSRGADVDSIHVTGLFTARSVFLSRLRIGRVASMLLTLRQRQFVG